MKKILSYCFIGVIVLIFVMMTYKNKFYIENYTNTTTSARDQNQMNDSSLDFTVEDNDVNIPVTSDTPECKSLENSGSLNQYLECCDNLDTHAYCSSADTLLRTSDMEINGARTTAAYGNCAVGPNDVVTTNRDVCRAVRTGKYLNAKYSGNCSNIEDLNGVSWCPDKNRPVAVNSSNQYKYGNTLDQNNLQRLKDSYGCNRIIRHSQCSDPCAMNPNSYECRLQQYNKYGGLASGNFLEGFETQNDSFFDDMISGFMDFMKHLYNGLFNVNSNVEGFALTDHTEQDFQRNLNKIKTSRNYDEYITAWNNFSENGNTITDRSGSGPVTLTKKNKCDTDRNGNLYFNNPTNVECYQEKYLEAGCSSSGTAYPTSTSGLTTNLNTYKSQISRINRGAHTQIVRTLRNNNVDSVNENYRKCYGSEKYKFPMFIDEQRLAYNHWVVDYHRVNASNGRYYMNPFSREKTKSSYIPIHNKGNTFFVRVYGYVTYPENCRSVRYSIRTDDGGALLLNGKKIIERWRLQGPTTTASNAITVSKDASTKHGMLHHIEFHMYEWYGGQHLEVKRLLYDGNGNTIDEDGNIKKRRSCSWVRNNDENNTRRYVCTNVNNTTYERIGQHHIFSYLV